MEESTIHATLTSLCEKYLIKVLIDPVEYKLLSPAAIDVEHDEEGNLVGIGVYDGTQSFYFTRITNDLRQVLSTNSLLAHNGKGDFDSLRQWGIPVSDDNLIWDTELIGHIIDSSRKGYGLKKLAKEDLGIEYPSYDALVGKKTAKVRRTLDKWPVPIVAMYNALDTYSTFKLFLLQQRQCGI